jgi:hypothetical protein
MNINKLTSTFRVGEYDKIEALYINFTTLE